MTTFQLSKLGICPTIGLNKDIDYRSISDFIPHITILAKRFLAGLPPYTDDSLASLYDHTPSSYLPVHWLPCVPAAFFHFDFRTMKFAMWCLGAITVMLRNMKPQNAWTPHAPVDEETVFHNRRRRNTYPWYLVLDETNPDEKQHISYGLFLNIPQLFY